jgi:hypothetical protein
MQAKLNPQRSANFVLTRAIIEQRKTAMPDS